MPTDKHPPGPVKDWLEAMSWRYATKLFDSTKKVPNEVLFRLLEALRLSASSFGLQLWKFLVIEDAGIKRELRPLCWNQPQIEDCSHLVVLCRHVQIEVDDADRFIELYARIRKVEVTTLTGYLKVIREFISRQTPEEQEAWLKNQVYIALGSLLLAAPLEGVDACPIEGFKRPEVDRLLHLPERGLSAVVLCPLGYRSPADRYALAPKVRYPDAQIIEFLDRLPAKG